MSRYCFYVFLLILNDDFCSRNQPAGFKEANFRYQIKIHNKSSVPIRPTRIPLADSRTWSETGPVTSPEHSSAPERSFAAQTLWIGSEVFNQNVEGGAEGGGGAPRGPPEKTACELLHERLNHVTGRRPRGEAFRLSVPV